VITLHGLILPQSIPGAIGRWSYWAFLTGVRISGLFASVFIVHSELMKSVLGQSYRIRNVVVIPHGTDSYPLTVPRSPKPNNLLFFGFIRPSKGIENLIKSLATIRIAIPNVILTVAGGLVRPEESTYMNHLNTEARQNHLAQNVHFKTGFLEQNERDSLASEATCLILPYTDKFVEVSGVVHDFAGYGVPIVCSNVPRFNEMTDEFDCLKVSPTPPELANAVLRILKDPELRSKLGNNLRLRAKQESWDVVAQQHLSLYKSLVSSRARQ
jgi:glycosyltransferase involved in cell wall biosynthesis